MSWPTEFNRSVPDWSVIARGVWFPSETETGHSRQLPRIQVCDQNSMTVKKPTASPNNADPETFV